MLKTAIAGAETREAGELIRILVNHPEIDLVAAYAPAMKGRTLSEIHHGLVGETDMKATDTLDLAALDVLFICTPDCQLPPMETLEARFPSLRIIDMTPERTAGKGAYGLSEINRKELVRGARSATLASAEGAAALIALYPAACHLLLPPGVTLEITTDTPDSPELRSRLSEEIMTRLNLAQSSFVTPPEIRISPSCGKGEVTATAVFSSTLSVDEALKAYDSVYDDHNFTFLLTTAPGPEEVCGTNRCIVTIDIPTPGKVRVRALTDGRMRGGAGGAVHLMNLLCGLHEKTGLALKAHY